MHRFLLLLTLLSAPALAQEPDPDAKMKEAAAKGLALETGEPIGGEEEAVEGGTIQPLKLPAGEIRPHMVWNDRKDALVVAEKRGVIRKIAVPAMREDRRFWVGADVWGLAQSKVGILVGVEGKGEIWVLKEEDLSVIQKVKMPDARDVVGFPKDLMAYCGRGERGMNLEIQVLDLTIYYVRKPLVALNIMKEQGQRMTIKKFPGAKQLSFFALPTGTPDGKYVFFATGNSLHRFRVEKETLVYEEEGPELGKYTRIEISPDSNYVAAPCDGVAPEGFPPLKPYGTYVFRTTDLQKPEWAIPGVRVVGYTRSGNKVFGLRDPDLLGLFTNKGTKEKALKIGTGVVRVFPHPDTGRLLVLKADEILWVNLK